MRVRSHFLKRGSFGSGNGARAMSRISQTSRSEMAVVSGEYFAASVMITSSSAKKQMNTNSVTDPLGKVPAHFNPRQMFRKLKIM